MSDKIQKKTNTALKENTQYALAFGLISTMLFVAGFPMFVIFFFGIFAYFLWKTFSQPPQSGTREVFEFYHSANEILRDDERRWFGFEVQEVIGRGERILQLMNGAPPLVYFTLGALYNKVEDHKSAINHLSYILENNNADEKTYIYPSPDLRNYVRVLRKIEREPADAPQTSAAIRALERARRNRGKSILEESRRQLAESNRKKELALAEQQNQIEKLAGINAENSYVKRQAETNFENGSQTSKSLFDQPKGSNGNGGRTQRVRKKQRSSEDSDHLGNRKPITEVLHEIYDK